MGERITASLTAARRRRPAMVVNSPGTHSTTTCTQLPPHPRHCLSFIEVASCNSEGLRATFKVRLEDSSLQSQCMANGEGLDKTDEQVNMLSSCNLMNQTQQTT